MEHFLESLPPSTFAKLYSLPSTCLAVFRLLPSDAKSIIIKLVFSPLPMKTEIVNCICEDAAFINRSIALGILIETSAGFHLQPNFIDNFRRLLTCNCPESFGTECISPDKNQIDIPFLDQYAKERWQQVLHSLVGSCLPSESTLRILLRAGLMAQSDGAYVITSTGFGFLLQDLKVQVWSLLIEYVKLTFELSMDLVQVLQFLFLVGNLQLGKSYSIEELTETQQTMLIDLRAFGLVYQRKKSTKRFYPTFLAALLSSPSEEPSEKGYIVIETNFRFYAYTTNPLSISIIHLFVHLKSRYPNLIVGRITRESVRTALQKGIKADQIIQFLLVHAHPNMNKKLPLTVMDQIRLWEMELNRLVPVKGYLYSQFLHLHDFEAVEAYAREQGYVKFVDKKNRRMVVSEEGHAEVKAFVKRKIARE